MAVNGSWVSGYHSEKLFEPGLPSQISKNMVKVLLFSFEQCFGTFTMLLVELSSEAGFLDIDLTTSFRVSEFKNIKARRIIFSLKIFKIESKFRKCKKKFRKYFLFLWSLHQKMPLLIREYLSLPVNGLTNSHKILHITQRDFFNLNSIPTDQ